jgi:hypothetical protein
MCWLMVNSSAEAHLRAIKNGAQKAPIRSASKTYARFNAGQNQKK